MTDFQNFLDAVREMREAQTKCDVLRKGYSGADLVNACLCEMAVDAMLARLLRAEPVSEKEAKLL